MTHRQKVLRFLFFAVNFSASVTLFSASIVAIAVGAINSPGASLGGVVVLVPSGLYAACEWFAYYRNQRSLELPMGALNLCGAAFMLLSLTKECADAVTREEPRSFGLLVVLSVLLLIAVDLLSSGWFRLRYSVHSPSIDSKPDSTTKA